MTSKLKTALLGVSALALIGTGPAFAQGFNDAQKAELGDLIREYILENPGIIFEAAEAHRTQEEADAKKQATEKIAEYKDVFQNPENVAMGNPKGDVTIVEFFDYNCGYCKRALPDLQKVVQADPNVRVVFKEMPILGPTSLSASQWALAAKKQDKYFEYHAALMEHRGPKDEENLVKIAERLGLDVDRMKKDAASDAIRKELDKSVEIAREIGVRGTPAFIVGDEFVPGYIPADQILKSVQAHRDQS